MIDVIEAIPVGVIEVDAQGKIALVNRSVERMFQTPRDQILGQTLEMLVPGSGSLWTGGELTRCPAALGLGNAPRQWRGRRSDGTVFPLSLTFNPVTRGTSDATLVLVMDITEQHRAHCELQSLNTLLVEKNAELERCVLSLSHDLRTPIVTILGYLGHMNLDSAPSEMRDLKAYLKRVQGATERLRTKIDGLVRLSRVGQRMPEPQLNDLDAAIRAAIEGRADELAARGIAVRVGLEAPEVWCDPQHLEQVLENLIGNSIRYGCGGSERAIEVVSRHVDADWVELGVNDKGPGVPAADAERIFGLFERLPNQAEGTGVGLALVRHVATRYGGQAWVEPGAGARFRVILPARQPVSESDAAPVSLNPGQAGT